MEHVKVLENGVFSGSFFYLETLLFKTLNEYQGLLPRSYVML